MFFAVRYKRKLSILLFKFSWKVPKANMNKYTQRPIRTVYEQLWAIIKHTQKSKYMLIIYMLRYLRAKILIDLIIFASRLFLLLPYSFLSRISYSCTVFSRHIAKRKLAILPKSNWRYKNLQNLCILKKFPLLRVKWNVWRMES